MSLAIYCRWKITSKDVYAHIYLWLMLHIQEAYEVFWNNCMFYETLSPILFPNGSRWAKTSKKWSRKFQEGEGPINWIKKWPKTFFWGCRSTSRVQFESQQKLVCKNNHLECSRTSKNWSGPIVKRVVLSIFCSQPHTKKNINIKE